MGYLNEIKTYMETLPKNKTSKNKALSKPLFLLNKKKAVTRTKWIIKDSKNIIST